ncbi:hypothetical protein NP493_578g02004 [Ridgeia piscesae]|uniref:TIR domain-containing protein n=1 Tax=Ridgeia piscesae TaxID=27915 RepID=A0AAD9KUR6_RIDPI|nr:hypothetical protein NP493_578g02004 [Ridgeia piscesae]
MISYSHADKATMIKLHNSLAANGIRVWVDVTGLKAGVDFLSKIGQAIIDSKMFVCLLSESSIKSKYCQDEVALAYVSSKAIFPIAIVEPRKLYPEMSTGMKLQLAGFEWNLFLDEDKFDENIAGVVTKMKAYLAKSEDNMAQIFDVGSTTEVRPRTAFNRQVPLRSTFTRKLTLITEKIPDDRMNSFWENHFANKTAVAWSDFVDAYRSDFKSVLDSLFTKTDQEWLVSILRRELVEDEQDTVTEAKYRDFCTEDGELQPFWMRVQEQAVESFTMKEVFDMDSSVRVEAIENLGKYRSTAVIEALLDLLKDKDNNVKTVAAISLARTGVARRDVNVALVRCLADKDRLVRESACLALGHLKVEAAVKKLVQLWRNDFISSVREAAQVALEQIGGEEANKAMHMTKVLAEEIRMLTQD